MNQIHFVVPELKHKDMVLNYKQEHEDNDEKHLHGSSMLDIKNSYEEWLAFIKNNQSQLTLPKGWVISSTYLVMDDKEESVIGMIDIRHELNSFLRSYGGHIGYGVRPSQRKKGYATQMLQLALKVCKDLAINEVMVACNKQNEGSRRTILKCGGILEKEFLHDDEMVQIYWITI